MHNLLLLSREPYSKVLWVPPELFAAMPPRMSASILSGMSAGVPRVPPWISQGILPGTSIGNFSDISLWIFPGIPPVNHQKFFLGYLQELLLGFLHKILLVFRQDFFPAISTETPLGILLKLLRRFIQDLFKDFFTGFFQDFIFWNRDFFREFK